jgi:hypothetical protein
MNQEREHTDMALIPFTNGWVKALNLKREEMEEVDHWVQRVEAWAERLADTLRGRAVTEWHGHAEVTILPLEGAMKMEEFDEDGQPCWEWVNPLLRVWVD